MTLRRDSPAFSLIELVIVIIILGIIASIAITRIGTGRQSAGESALKGHLHTLRNAIDQYYLEHKNLYPAATTNGKSAKKTNGAFRGQLIEYATIDGISSVDQDAAFPLGLYIRGDIPALPVGANTGSNFVTVVEQQGPLTANPVDGNGWIYNITTGQISANATEIGSDGKSYDSY